MAVELVVPLVIEAVIAKFDQDARATDEFKVKAALVEARGSLAKPTDAENLGA